MDTSYENAVQLYEDYKRKIDTIHVSLMDHIRDLQRYTFLIDSVPISDNPESKKHWDKHLKKVIPEVFDKIKQEQEKLNTIVSDMVVDLISFID